VEHRQGPATRGLAPVRKTIYSLNDLREILFGCNRRYLEYLSSLDDFAAGIRALDRLTQPRSVKGCNVKGRNFFSRDERTLLAALQRPGFNASAAPTSCCGSPNALLQPSPDNALVCAISASSNASPALIATISPALAAPPSPPAAASPNTP
jgi:hypothetical protein